MKFCIHCIQNWFWTLQNQQQNRNLINWCRVLAKRSVESFANGNYVEFNRFDSIIYFNFLFDWILLLLSFFLTLLWNMLVFFSPSGSINFFCSSIERLICTLPFKAVVHAIEIVFAVCFQLNCISNCFQKCAYCRLLQLECKWRKVLDENLLSTHTHSHPKNETNSTREKKNENFYRVRVKTECIFC